MTAIASPAVSRSTLHQRDELVATLHGIVSQGRVIHEEQGRRVYATDAFGSYSALPLAVVLPATEREVSQVLRFCFETGLKVFPRGAGTSLTGSAVGAEDGILLCLSLMNRILEINVSDRMVRVEAGATNSSVSQAVEGRGLRFAPNPASRAVSTIGGNIATNAGGARGFLLGPTADHVLALRIALIDGEVVQLGSGELEAPVYDLMGLLFGSEGLLGVIVEATLRVVPQPEARQLVAVGLNSVSAAVSCSDAILSVGAAVSALEIFDRQAAVVCEAFASTGLPQDAEALLLVEIEANASEIAEQCASVLELTEAFDTIGSLEFSDPDKIDSIWHAYDAVFTALGRLGAIRCLDVAVPSARLAEAISKVDDIATRHNLRVVTMCRAAEGLVRSVLIYDPNEPDDHQRLANAVADVAHMCSEIEGELAGEHGIGVAKRDVLGYQLESSDIEFHWRLKSVFDKEGLLNSGKVYPLSEHDALSTSV